ncbi:DHA1 family multidrug resistance protein-like MFS transporter [Paenibacillus rhizosphaerae]|uniref:DHA1 family multidrug resistance protein-like MFS transporter n=1 Tax=Paenibacillus rhizosphaerae TaxID=297318 RepID=A0A839U115_9BACL|nr:MFS transporter [Paenibacillus rhizosphaerae]MBB3131328.1 DHA1 family multidrug resistance protein-like MFS transporter [Paenibacillus rhizosphaerae]
MNLLFRNNGALGLLMVNIFLAMAAYGLVVPVMPTLMRNLGLTGASVGYLTAAYAVTQLLFSPWGGRLGDTIGRKKIIVAGLALLAISEAIFGFSSSVYMLFLSRLLGGAGVALIFPGIMAFTADITTENERAKGIGYISAAMSTGFIIGPGLGGFLAEYGVRVPFYVAAALVGFVALLSMMVLPESMKKAHHIETRLAMEREGLIRQIWQSRKAPYFATLIVLLVLGFGLSNFETVFGLYLDAKHQFGPNDIALVLTIGAVVGVVIQVGLLDVLVKRLGEMKVMYLSLALGGASIFIILFVHSYWAITIVTTLIFVFFDLIRPAASSLLSKAAGDRQGYVAGLNSTFTSLGTIIGSVASGILYDISLSLPYIAAGTTFLLCLVGLKIHQGIKQSA